MSGILNADRPKNSKSAYGVKVSAAVLLFVTCILSAPAEDAGESSSLLPSSRDSQVTVEPPTPKIMPAKAKKATGSKADKCSGKNIVPAVEKYLKDNLNDPGSLQYVKWGPLTPSKYLDGCKVVVVRYRAKNPFNALILHETVFTIQNNEVIFTHEGSVERLDFRHYRNDKGELVFTNLPEKYKPQNGTKNNQAKIARRYEISFFSGLQESADSVLRNEEYLDITIGDRTYSIRESLVKTVWDTKTNDKAVIEAANRKAP